MLIDFIMLIAYANKLCKLMSGQIDEMSDQNEDLKGHMSSKRRKIISSPATVSRNMAKAISEVLILLVSLVG